MLSPIQAQGHHLPLVGTSLIKNHISVHSRGSWAQPPLFPQVMESVLDVEKPLVQGQIRDIDVHLKKAEESLKWNSEGQRALKYKFTPF